MGISIDRTMLELQQHQVELTCEDENYYYFNLESFNIFSIMVVEAVTLCSNFHSNFHLNPQSNSHLSSTNNYDVWTYNIWTEGP